VESEWLAIIGGGAPASGPDKKLYNIWSHGRFTLVKIALVENPNQWVESY
jgi:hypothetical protein